MVSCCHNARPLTLLSQHAPSDAAVTTRALSRLLVPVKPLRVQDLRVHEGLGHEDLRSLRG